MRITIAVTVFFAFFAFALAEWHVEIVDESGGVGYDPAIALDSTGNPRIAYNRSGYGAKFAEFNGVSWEIEYIYQPSYGNAGWFDIVTDDNNLAHVVFGGGFGPGAIYTVQDSISYDWLIDYLPEYASCTSLELDSQGQPCIAILDSEEDNRFLYKDGSVWQSELIEEGNDQDGFISLALDNSDRAHVAYNSAATALDVKYAERDSTGQWLISTVDSTLSSEPRGISLALNDLNEPRISYNVAGELRYAAWNGFSWDIETVFSIDTGPMEFGTSMALDTEGCPHIVHCTSASDSILYSVNLGAGWETSRVCAIDLDGGNPDLVLDSMNRPHIAFHSGHDDRDLMYAFNDETGIAGPSSPPAEVTDLVVSSNPFSEYLGITFSLPENSNAELLVYDLQGRRIAAIHSGALEAGIHSASWIPGGSVAYGGYIILLQTEEGTTTCEKVVYLK